MVWGSKLKVFHFKVHGKSVGNTMTPFLMRSLWKRPLNENGHFLADRLAIFLFYFFFGGAGGGKLWVEIF